MKQHLHNEILNSSDSKIALLAAYNQGSSVTALLLTWYQVHQQGAYPTNVGYS